MSTDQIAFLEVERGRVGLVPCPGTGSEADARTDLERFRRWGACAVVTALDDADFCEGGLERLGESVEATGMEWYHVPVRDFGVPELRAEARWRCASLRLRRHLATGRSVIVHCRGGLGRTGTLAARLLVDAGIDPHEAIAAVRRARPGAVETPEQAGHVLSQTPGRPLPDLPTLEERVLGCLLGGAVGDGFGYTVEFSSLDRIRAEHGTAGLVEPVYSDGRLIVSDDTQMTMFTAEGLIRAHARARDRGIVSVEDVVWRAYRRWLATQGIGAERDRGSEAGWLIEQPALHFRRAPGNTCLQALQSPSFDADGRARNDSKGCGGVMRVAPVGLVPAFFDAGRCFELGSSLAALTHGHPSGTLSAGAFAATVRLLLDGEDLLLASSRSLDLLRSEDGGAETAAAIRLALGLSREGAIGPSDGVARLGQGWVGEEALAIALFAVLQASDLPEAIRVAANHDGDSDSTASLAGQLRGARDGLSAVPQRWVRRLDVLDPLLTLAIDLAAISTHGQPVLRPYPPN